MTSEFHHPPTRPGLTKKRAMLGVGSSPTLSQLLKEAKSDVAAMAGEGDADSAPLPLSYSRFFDEYHGELMCSPQAVCDVWWRFRCGALGGLGVALKGMRREG